MKARIAFFIIAIIAIIAIIVTLIVAWLALPQPDDAIEMPDIHIEGATP